MTELTDPQVAAIAMLFLAALVALYFGLRAFFFRSTPTEEPDQPSDTATPVLFDATGAQPALGAATESIDDLKASLDRALAAAEASRKRVEDLDREVGDLHQQIDALTRYKDLINGKPPLVSLANLFDGEASNDWAPSGQHQRLAVCLRPRVGEDFRDPLRLIALFQRITDFVPAAIADLQNNRPPTDATFAFALSGACDLIALAKWPTRTFDSGEQTRAASIAERLIEGYKKGFAGKKVAPEASAGWYHCASETMSLRQIVARAEVAVRTKNECVMFDVSRPTKDELDALSINALREDSRIALAYQPKYRFDETLEMWVLCGLEALLRVKQEAGWLSISPPAVMKHFRGLDRATTLNDRLVHTAAGMALFLNDNVFVGPARLTVSVNVSPADFNPEFVEAVSKSFKADESVLRTTDIEFEILEDDEMTSACVAAATRAVGKGFWLALDDFGTQRSNLDRLDAFRHDGLTIKLDRKIILRALAENSEILREQITALVRVWTSKKYRVVAEGVPSKADASDAQQYDPSLINVLYDDAAIAVIRSMGIDRIQGYVFAAPMSESEIRDRIAAGDHGLSTNPRVYQPVRPSSPTAAVQSLTSSPSVLSPDDGVEPPPAAAAIGS